MKKTLSIILSLCMLLSLIQPAVLADTGDTAEAAGTVVASGYYGAQENNQGFGNADLTAEVPTEIKSDNFKWYLYDDGLFTFEAVDPADNDYIANLQNPANAPWVKVASQIKKVVIPDGVKRLGGRLFEWSNGTALEEVVLPEGLEVLMAAFPGSKVKTINFPSSLTSIATFSYCSGLNIKLVVPSGVKTLSANNFNNTGIQELRLNGQTVETDAFTSTTSLKTISAYGNAVIKAYAFNNSTNVNKLVLGPDVTIDDYAITAYTNKDETTKLYPETATLPTNLLNGTVYGVKGSDAERYANKHNIKFVEIDGLGTAGSLTYEVCDTVLTISGEGEMPDYTAGDAPWYALADKIRTIVVSDGVTKIGNNAFYGLSSAKNAVIPETVTSIGSGAYAGCTKLAAVVIPDAVTAIGTGAFDTATAACVGTASSFANTDGYKTYTAGVKGDTTISETENNTNINWAVYGGDTLVISGTGKMRNTYNSSWGAPWVAYKDDLKTAVVEYGVIWVTQQLFNSNVGYSKMETVIIADGVTQMRNCEIDGCPNLVRYDTSNKVTYIENWVTNGRTGKLQELYIPGTVTTRQAYANFSGLSSLTKLVIEEGFNVLNIEGTDAGQCFIKSATKLKELTIPKSVTHIGNYSFDNLSALEKIEILNPDCTLSEKAFNNCNNNNVVIYCAANSAVEARAKELGFKTDTYIGKGTIGGLSWIITGDGELTISGEGAIPDYSADNAAPWHDNADKVKALVVENGVTAIGAYAFADFTAATEAKIAKSVTAVGENAFTNHNSALGIICETDAVKKYAEDNGINVIVGGTLSNGTVNWKIVGDTLTVYGSGIIPNSSSDANGWMWYANYTEAPWKNIDGYSYAIKNIVIEEGITRIPCGAFGSCHALTAISIPDSVVEIGNNAIILAVNLEFAELPTDSTLYLDNFFGNTNLKRAVIKNKTYNRLKNLKGSKTDYTVITYSDSQAYTDAQTLGITTKTIKATGEQNGIEWVVTEDGMLDIWGIGDLSALESAPWADYASDINTVYIEEGITGLGADLFSGISNAYIELPDSLTALGANAITAASSTVRVPVYVKEIDDNAFSTTTTIWSYKNSKALEFAKTKSLSYDERESLRILALGNSFTQDSTMYLYDIAAACGAEDIVVGRMFHAGASLYAHLRAANHETDKNEVAADGTVVTDYDGFYLYSEQRAPGIEDYMIKKDKTDFDYGLKAQDWDIIVLQAWYPENVYGLNGGDVAGNVENEEWLNELTAIIKKRATNPDVELGFNMVWSMERSKSQPYFGYDLANNEYNNGATMADWNSIVEQTETYLSNNEDYTYVIPVGTAIENARTSYLAGIRGKTKTNTDIVGGLQRDRVHLNDIGKYIAAMTWTKVLKPDYDVAAIDWTPNVFYTDGTALFDADIAAAAKEAVTNAVTTWDEVTDSAYPYRIMSYADGKATIAVSNTVRNSLGYDNSKAAKLIFAEYNSSDKLVSYLPVDVTLTYDEVIAADDADNETKVQLNAHYTKNIIESTGFAPAAGNKVKVMLWDGADTLIPLCKTLDITTAAAEPAA